MSGNLRLNLTITDLTDENRQEKYVAAVNHLAKAMGQPVTIRPRTDDAKHEEWGYKVQEEFTQSIILQLAGMMDDIYHATCEYLDLPPIKTFSKGFFDRFLTVKGKLRFNPETGRPLLWKDFDRLVQAIQKFLSLGTGKLATKVVLGSESMARLMAFVEKNTTVDKAREMSMEAMQGRGHNFDKLSTSMNEFKDHFKLPESDVERLGVVERQVGDWFQDLSDKTVGVIKNTYYEGVIQKKSKGEIAQNLFDRFGDQNRDWRRVVETEHAEIFNNAYLKSEVAKEPEGQKVYFMRREILDGHTCRYCAKIKGIIALWSEVPLEDEAIEDQHAQVAIWEGKSNFGRKAADYWVPAGTAHPHCRGSWERWYPPVASDKMTQKIAEILERKKKRDVLYNEAMQEVRASKKFMDESTKDFEQELNTVYTEKLKAADLL